jgi:phage-related protein
MTYTKNIFFFNIKMCSKQENFSFPGLARSIVRPVVRTTTTVVKRGEKVVGDVAGIAIGAVKNTVSGTSVVARGVVKDGSKVVGNVAGLATRTVKNTISGTSKVASGVVSGSVKVVRNAAGIKSTRKTKKSPKKTSRK